MTETNAGTGTSRTNPGDRPGVACSFCMKRPSQVLKLISGAGVFICNECVDLCVQILAAGPAKADAGHADTGEAATGEADNGEADTAEFSHWEERVSDEELLAHLPMVAALSDQVALQLTTWIRQARSRGITWTKIGEALGITRQSAWERFSGED